MDVTRRIAKICLIEPHGDVQLTYASLTAGRQHDDHIVAEAQIWAARQPAPGYRHGGAA